MGAAIYRSYGFVALGAIALGLIIAVVGFTSKVYILLVVALILLGIGVQVMRVIYAASRVKKKTLKS